MRSEKHKYRTFPWGKIIHTFVYDFDGIEATIVKYNPWKDQHGSLNTHQIDSEKIEYHCDEISQSSDSLIALLIAWIAYKQLGHNQNALTQGIVRMLKLSNE